MPLQHSAISLTALLQSELILLTAANQEALTAQQLYDKSEKIQVAFKGDAARLSKLLSDCYTRKLIARKDLKAVTADGQGSLKPIKSRTRYAYYIQTGRTSVKDPFISPPITSTSQASHFSQKTSAKPHKTVKTPLKMPLNGKVSPNPLKAPHSAPSVPLSFEAVAAAKKPTNPVLPSTFLDTLNTLDVFPASENTEDTPITPLQTLTTEIVRLIRVTLHKELQNIASDIKAGLLQGVQSEIGSLMKGAEPTTAARVVEPPSTGIKKVLIVGLLPGQQQVIRKEYRGCFDLRFEKDKQHNGGLHKLKSAASEADRIVFMTKFASHASQDIIKSVGKTINYANGGLTSVKQFLDEWFLEGV